MEKLNNEAENFTDEKEKKEDNAFINNKIIDEGFPAGRLRFKQTDKVVRKVKKNVRGSYKFKTDDNNMLKMNNNGIPKFNASFYNAVHSHDNDNRKKAFFYRTPRVNRGNNDGDGNNG